MVRPLVLDVLYPRHQHFHRDTITAEPVGHDSTRQRAFYPQYLSEESLRSPRITVTPRSNINSATSRQL
jgi:hypothetical protein